MRTIREIQTIVARRYGVTVLDLTSKRQGESVRPRHVAMWIARQITDHSLPEIGRAFGGRDHTTVMNALRRIEALMADEEGTRRALWALVDDVDRANGGNARRARMRLVA